MQSLPNLEYFRKFASGQITAADKSPFNYPPPIAKTLGFDLVDVGEATACIEIETKTEVHGNPMGTVHGGVLCDIADAAIGTAHSTTLAEGESFTSVDLQIGFFRPVWNEKIRATAKPVHRGKLISRYVCDLVRADGKLVAQVTSTVVTLRGERAAGR